MKNLSKNKYYLAVGFFALIITTIAVSGLTNAAEDGFGKFLPKHGPENNAELREAMDNGDYEAWKELAGDSRMAENMTEEKFNEMQERHQKMQEIQKAIEEGNYSSWKELNGDNKITETITEENFAQFAEMQNLMKDGKFEEAKTIRDGLGLEMRGFDKGFRGGFKMGMENCKCECSQ